MSDIRRVTVSSFLPFIPTAVSFLCRLGGNFFWGGFFVPLSWKSLWIKASPKCIDVNVITITIHVPYLLPLLPQTNPPV